MYADWTSVQNDIQTDAGYQSVLSRFPLSVGRDVANSVVRSLAPSMIRSNEQGDRSTLQTDAEVKWTMQVLCYGLTLPLTDHETIRDCVSIYCDWFLCITDPTRSCIPAPLADDPNSYVCDMLHHLYNVFVPRPADTSGDLVKRQAMLCHRVLLAIQTNFEKSTVITKDTWDSLLRFLLAINDTLLSPPAEKDSIGVSLCERVLSVLFEMWIQACVRCFPSPSLWKTLQELCAGWRHHETLVVQWHRVVTAFTSRLLRIVYGKSFRGNAPPAITEDDERLIPDGIDDECIIQCWFRFLHVLGDPVDLAQAQVISNTQKFLQMALTSEAVIEPHQHDCLRALPTIFYRAMRSLAYLVDSFLELGHRDHHADADWLSTVAAFKPPPPPSQPAATTPPSTRRSRPSIIPHAKPKEAQQQRHSLVDGPTVHTAVAPLVSPTTVEIAKLSPCRPTVNSLLHLLGSWLLEASLVGVRVHGSKDGGSSAMFERSANEAGRAQACGALCRIFCSKRTGEEILPVYSSRFYISLYYALNIDMDLTSIPMVLASVITNSTDLLRVDLDGVQVLLPQLLGAILDMAQRFKYKHDGTDEDVDLRRATINILLSMLCLPLHFGDLSICAILDEQSTSVKTTFVSLRAPICELLVGLLTHETDSTNTQMLLGGLVVCMLDIALYENRTKPGEEPTNESSASQDLFGRASSLVCNRLMATWKMELGTALATLEVLSALARIKFVRPNALMCKRAVNWICEFVVYQCLRPAPAHSKDLHSMIVAAFQCLTTWLLQHDFLMQDKECMQTVLQVVELGISGTRSQARASDPSRLKGDKELKPVSMRVRDAAEALVTIIIDYVGCFPPPCGPESLCTLLDEESLMKYCSGGGGDGGGGSSAENGVPEKGLSFQYYVLDGTTIVGLLERSLDGAAESLPTVTSVVRGSFGRHAWTMQLRHQPRSQNSVSSSTAKPSFDMPMTMSSERHSTAPAHHRVHQQYFPDIVQQIPPVLADLSIPALENTMSDQRADLIKLQALVASQVQFEQTCRQNSIKHVKPLPRCTEPSVCESIQTARLFLSHYGFLTLEGLKTGTSSSMPPSLVCLSSKDGELYKDLRALDALPIRTADTVQIFYVKTGQTKLTDILQNVTHRDKVQGHFLEFVCSLGWSVDVHKHAGWTGSVATSWKVNDSHKDPVYTDDTGGSIYDGQQQVIYWSDVSSEVVFIIPSPTTFCSAPGSTNSASLTTSVSSQPLSNQQSSAESSASSLGSDNRGNSFGKGKSMSLDLETVPMVGPGAGTDGGMLAESSSNITRLRRSGRTAGTMFGVDVQVFVVWLESYEDHVTFPVVDLLRSPLAGPAVNLNPSTNQKQSLPPHVCVIYIHALRNGLFRIHLQSQQTRESEAVPLVDGMVVSRRLLGHLVRQTTVNIFRRRQLDSELFQPPHVRRKLKIKEIVEKYKCTLSEPEFYEALFLHNNI